MHQLLNKKQPIGDSPNYKGLLFFGTKEQLTKCSLGLMSICLAEAHQVPQARRP
jgi:hypothetical protein